MNYATLWADKFQSAKSKTFNSYEDLRKYLVSEVVGADVNNWTLGELISVYNRQHGDLVELNYAVYVNTKGEVVYAS